MFAFCKLWPHSILYLFSHRHEDVNNAGRLFSGGLYEGHLVFASQIFGFLTRYLPQVLLVTLVAYEDLADIGLGVLLDFLDPVAHSLK